MFKRVFESLSESLRGFESERVIESLSESLSV